MGTVSGTPVGFFCSPLEATEASPTGRGASRARGCRGPKDPLDLLGMMTPGATGGCWHGAPDVFLPVWGKVRQPLSEVAERHKGATTFLATDWEGDV